MLNRLQDLLKIPKKDIVDKQALTKIATTQFEDSIMTITELLNKEYKVRLSIYMKRLNAFHLMKFL